MNENVIVCMYVGERVIPILYVFCDLVITHVYSTITWKMLMT